MKKILLSLGLILLGFTGLGQNVSWNFATASPSSNTATNVTASDVTQGNNNGTTQLITNAVPSAGYAGASGTNNAGAAARTGALNTGASGSAYFEFTITPNPTVVATLTNINFGTRSTPSGPQAYTLRSSLDNYASDVMTGTIPNNSTWTLQSPPPFNISSAVSTSITFRIYGYNGSGAVAQSTANWRIDDLILTVNAGPLPVTLISFKANITESQQTVLKWATASEKDNDYFVVERSKNASDFELVGKVKGKGTIDLRNDYSFTDESPLKGINYYRLKQVDLDGQYSYTRAESVIKDGDGTISLYPNPTTNILKINFEDTDQIEDATIYDMMGRVVKTIIGNQDKYEVVNLPQGKYIIQIDLLDGRSIKNSFVKN